MQPYAALGLGLVAAGHDVTFAGLERFQWFLERLPFRTVTLMQEPLREMLEFLQQKLSRSESAPWRTVRANTHLAFEEWIAAASGADLLIAHPLIFAAPDLSEYFDIPLVVANNLPAVCPTGEFPNTYLMGRSMGSAINRLTYKIIPAVMTPLSRMRRQWRSGRLHLRTPMESLVGGQGFPIYHLHGHSRYILPRPADWPDAHLVTGYWTSDRLPPNSPAVALSDFVSAGPAPVYAGFGSMASSDPEPLTRTVCNAVRDTGSRAIVARCSGALSAQLAAELLPGQVFGLDGREGVSHDWLFPQCSALVTHGGPGTVGAALRAGKPQVIVPFGMDQPFWAHRAHRIGVATKPLPIKKCTAEALGERLRTALSSDEIRQKASEISSLVREEDGVMTAVEKIERIHESYHA